MGVFETEANLSLEAFTDFEIDKMIEELNDEKERREIFNKINAVDKILKVLYANAKPLKTSWFTLIDGNDFNLNAVIDAFEKYRERIKGE